MGFDHKRPCLGVLMTFSGRFSALWLHVTSWWRCTRKKTTKKKKILITFIDEEAGVDEQPVPILLRRLQHQSGRQLVLQEGHGHALLQVVGGGGEAGRQPPGAIHTKQSHSTITFPRGMCCRL